MENIRKSTTKLGQIWKNIRKFFTSIRNRIGSIIESRPLTSFFGVLALIIVVIVVGNSLRKPPVTVEEVKKQPKEVEVFSIGKAPKMAFSGKVEKTGALKIGAQTSGIVQNIYVTEGGKVYKGQMLVGISNSYQGGNIASVSRQIAEKSNQLTEENYPEQVALIHRQKEVAEQSDINADTLREIATSSIQSTQDLISLNQEIISSLDGQIQFLESTNVEGSNDVAILQAKQGKAGVEAGLLNLKTALANQQYQATTGNPPERLSDLGKDIALGQLNLQEKSLNLAKEVSQLNLRIAQISESLMYPASPCSGVVERISTSLGSSVNPGQPLVSIACNKTAANVIVLVSGDVAKQLSRFEKSNVMIGTKSVELLPRYISTEPTDGNLHSVTFTVPEEFEDQLGNGSAIAVEMPIGNAQSTASVPYIPIDAVFQTQSTAIIYTASQSAEGKWMASGKEISLGQVFGSYVEVQKGLGTSDQVIVSRNVVSGDEVTIK